MEQAKAKPPQPGQHHPGPLSCTGGWGRGRMGLWGPRAQPPAPPGLETQLPAHRRLGDEHFLRWHSPSTHRSWCLGRGWKRGAQSTDPIPPARGEKGGEKPPAHGTAPGTRPPKPPHHKGLGATFWGHRQAPGCTQQNPLALTITSFYSSSSFLSALLTPPSPGTGLWGPQDALCPTGTVAFPRALSTPCTRELSPSPAIPTVLQEAPASPTEPGCTHGCPRGPARLSRGRSAGS